MLRTEHVDKTLLRINNAADIRSGSHSTVNFISNFYRADIHLADRQHFVNQNSELFVSRGNIDFKDSNVFSPWLITVSVDDAAISGNMAKNSVK